MTTNVFHNDWDDQLQQTFTQPYYAQLRAFLKTAYQEEVVYPPMDELWTAFQLTPFKQVKVALLGRLYVLNTNDRKNIL